MIGHTRVTAWCDSSVRYSAIAPFHPEDAYPEAPFPERSAETNRVYKAVRECFIHAGLDKDNLGSSRWNPLRDFINPGETVLLKPNMVKERHPRDPSGWEYVLTHGSIVRAVSDYVWLALRGKGKIIIADAPQTDSSFSEMVRLLGLDKIRDFFLSKGMAFELIDLRLEEWENKDGVIVGRRPLKGDPRGGISFDLGDNSEFVGHRGAGRYYGADYDANVVNKHHSGGRHEYMIAASAIQCDVLFSLPKLKTHKKAGITVSLKNLVGVNGDKNWLPHHTEASPARGGDERPGWSRKQRLERTLVLLFRRLSLTIPGLGTWIHRRARHVGGHVFGDTETIIRSGNWAGNDTVWRMALDLNKIILYGNSDGTMREARPENRKPHLVLVDGIVAGEGNGPLNPDPVNAGLIVFGVHPASVDATCALLMGFDPDHIPIIRQSFKCRGYPLAEWSWRDIEVSSNVPAWNKSLSTIDPASTFSFRPHFGWVGSIERTRADRVSA